MGGEEFFLVLLFAALDYRAPISPACDWRVRLDRQPIERQVRRSQVQRSLEIVFPRPIQMLGKGENQVERDVVDAAAAECSDRGADLVGVVGPMHPFKRGFIEALR